jgi:tRNA-specific 2-thiouridylase
VKRLRPETASPGNIVDLNGGILGTHEGVVHFTIGQRRGIDIGGQPEPLYVVRIEPESQRLVVGPRRALAVSAAKVADLNWIAEDQREVEAKVRSLARPVEACWDGGRLLFITPEYGVAPGQSAVFYNGERLLGGGTIIETESAALEGAAAA